MTQQTLPHTPVPRIIATRALCLAEALWNLAMAVAFGAYLTILPTVFAATPLWMVACGPGGFFLAARYGALALRWTRRLPYLRAPAHVDPTHWRDLHGLSWGRLAFQALLVGVFALVGVLLLQEGICRGFGIGLLVAAGLQLFSAVAGLVHLRNTIRAPRAQRRAPGDRDKET